MNTDVNINNEQEYRPCIVLGKKALFHKWVNKSYVYNPIMRGQVGGVVESTIAIVEYEDGQVVECLPHQVRFIDNKFGQFSFWDPIEK